MSRRYLILGHSHIGALRQALVMHGDRGEAPREIDFILMRQREAVLLPGGADGATRVLAENWRQPEWGSELRAICDRADHVFFLWQGGQFMIRMTVAVGGDFDFVLPADEDPKPTAETLIPYAVIEAWAESAFNTTFDLIWDFLAPSAAAGRVSFLTPAPPLPAAAVKDRLLASPGLMKVIEEMGVDLNSTGLIGDDARAKAWNVMVDVYERKANSFGCELIRPPATVFDGGGMLGEAFWGQDASHANNEYGRLYVEEILCTVGRPDFAVERERYSGRLS